MLSRTFIRTTRSIYRPSTFIPARTLSQTTRVAARKDAMGKDDLKPEPNEYSKSASDDEAARIDGTAFNPNQTRPEEQLESGEQEKGTVSAPSKGEGNPLNASPANHEISQPRKGTEGGAESSSAQSGQGPSDRQRSSGGSTTGGSGSYKSGKGKKYD
ncbi:hypothetical protein B9Z65_291 [Elsinoe australis]|uniref:Uncharacterized protein n=1 Tax=Elsinoe australis TaxID=40998 RepID=A0A2P7ZQ54_9PEZI|nr:hypothetical protein B9Z65_291 [Elsinoe australis]